MSDGEPIPCVGAVVTDGQGRLLLIRRANEPGRGLWSLPGGRVEPGETDEQAVVREVAEETGLTVSVGRLAGRVRIGHYDVADYVCDVLSGTPVAATDATDVAWLDPRTVPTTPDLVDILVGWGVLAAPAPPAAPVRLDKTRSLPERTPRSWSQQPIGVRVLMVPLLPFVALWLALKAVGRQVDRAVAGLERALLTVIRPVGRALLRCVRVLERWARRAATVVGHALTAAAKLLARPLRLLARLGAVIGRGLARVGASCARALVVVADVVLVRPLRAAVRALSPLLRTVRQALVLCGRVLASSAATAARSCRAAARRTAAGLRVVVRPIVRAAHACRPVLIAAGRTLRRGCWLVWRGIVASARGLVSAGLVVTRPVGRGLVVAGRAVRAAIAVVVRPARAALRSIVIPVSAAARAAVAPFRGR